MKNQYNFAYDNSLPTIIFDKRVLTVNNRKSTAKKMKDVKANIKDGDDLDFELLKILIGEEDANYINELDLPLPAYQKLFTTIMAAYNGIDPDEMEKKLSDTQF